MVRAGRKRKEGRRWDNGRVVPEREIGILPETIARRIELVGKDWDQPQAGYALGQLKLRGTLSERQHDAGIRLRQVWLRWASLAGIPAHEVTQRRGGLTADVDTATWEKAREAFQAAASTVKRCRQSGLVWATVEGIVMDNYLPPMFVHRGVAVAALQLGLDELARHFGL